MSESYIRKEGYCQLGPKSRYAFSLMAKSGSKKGERELAAGKRGGVKLLGFEMKQKNQALAEDIRKTKGDRRKIRCSTTAEDKET